MKGTHLARIARAQRAGFRLPLDGVQVETIFMTVPEILDFKVQTMFYALDGEVVVDMPEGFVHLRKGEVVTTQIGTAKFSPVEMVSLLRLSREL